MIMTILFFVMMTGITLGGLFAVQKDGINLLQIIFFIIIFLFLCYIGMIMGSAFTGWISAKLLEYVLTIIALVFIVACATRFHRPFSFFYREDRILLLLIACLFLLMGLQWGLLQLKVFFTLASAFLFTISFIIGLFVHFHVKQQRRWRYTMTCFIPLVWIFIAAMLKLVI